MSHWENEGTQGKGLVRGFGDETLRLWDGQLSPSGAKCPRRACVPTKDKVEQKEVGSKSDSTVFIIASDF